MRLPWLPDQDLDRYRKNAISMLRFFAVTMMIAACGQDEPDLQCIEGSSLYDIGPKCSSAMTKVCVCDNLDSEEELDCEASQQGKFCSPVPDPEQLCSDVLKVADTGLSLCAIYDDTFKPYHAEGYWRITHQYKTDSCEAITNVAESFTITARVADQNLTWIDPVGSTFTGTVSSSGQFSLSGALFQQTSYGTLRSNYTFSGTVSMKTMSGTSTGKYELASGGAGSCQFTGTFSGERFVLKEALAR